MTDPTESAGGIEARARSIHQRAQESPPVTQTYTHTFDEGGETISSKDFKRFVRRAGRLNLIFDDEYAEHYGSPSPVRARPLPRLLGAIRRMFGLNTRPRKTLDWDTPAQRLAALVDAA